MLTAIPRYGARVIPNTEQTIDAIAEASGQLVHGPHIAAFEHAFAVQVHASHAVSDVVRPDGVLTTCFTRCGSLRARRSFCPR